MNEQFRNALVSQVDELIEELVYLSDERLQPPSVIDYYEALSGKLREFKWPVQRIVDLGKSELTRLIMRDNESMNVDEGLRRAVSNVDVDHVRLFLQEFDADPNSFDENLHTPIFYLYSEDYEFLTEDDDRSIDAYNAVEIMKMLIAKGAKMVTSRDGYNELQIRGILVNGNAEAVSLILDMDVIDLKERYNDGFTVVHFLAQNRDPNTLTLLQNRDFCVDSRDRIERTPLWVAAARGVAHAVEFLLKKGADMNVICIISLTPLGIATSNYEIGVADHMECILLLLEHGVDVQAQHLRDDNLPPTTVFDVLCQLQVNKRPSEVIMQHLALQAAIGTTITEHVQNTINSDPDLKKELDDSRQLLQRKIHGSCKLLSVLTCEEEKLISLMRNEQLAEKLQSYLQSNSSMYYNRLLQKRLTKAGQIMKLRGKAAFVVGKLMEMDYDCQPVVVDVVLRHLDLADLNTLLSLKL